MSRRAFITSVNPAYMYGLNATINAARHFNTDAEFHILYRTNEMPPDYMDLVSRESGLKVLWIESPPFGPGFNIPKYGYAAACIGKCDSVCLIDADLFVCSNVDEHFAKAEKGFLVTAEHEYGGGNLHALNFANPSAIRDRSCCQLADFPVFVSPEKQQSLLKYWHTSAKEIGTEFDHPLIVLNRAVAMHLKEEQVIALDGHHWVADARFWEVCYTTKDLMLFDYEGRVYAVHNRWWREGRAAGEIIAAYQQREIYQQPGFETNAETGESNFNTILNLMKEYVAMNPKIAWPCVVPGPIDRHAIWKWWLSLPEGQAFTASRKVKNV